MTPPYFPSGPYSVRVLDAGGPAARGPAGDAASPSSGAELDRVRRNRRATGNALAAPLPAAILVVASTSKSGRPRILHGPVARPGARYRDAGGPEHRHGIMIRVA